MEEKMSKQKIERLDISDSAMNLLKENKITTIGQLCKKSKTDLRDIQLVQNDVNKIEIELQLLGLDLKAKN